MSLLYVRKHSLGEYAVNSFDVNAVGWVLTLNARVLSQEERQELYGLWTQLLRAHTEDKNKVDWLIRLMLPRSIRLSEKSTGAFAKLANRMAELHPERFGCDALRVRRNGWALQTALSFLCCFLTANCLPNSYPLFREIVLTLFVMSCAGLVPTILLWRVAAAVRHLSANPQMG
jgi:hypothetical protein